MFPSDQTSPFLDTLDRRPLPNFDLRDAENFPYKEFQNRNSKYTEMEKWIDGTIFDETIDMDGKTITRYPVKINPVPSIVLKHAYALFGESPQDDRPLVYPRVLSPDKGKKDLAREAEEMLYRIWWESNGRSIQMENGLMSQIYGGCIFKVTYDPTDVLHTVPIRIENPHPKYFVGRPSATDMWRLRECWIVTPVTEYEARQNGVDPSVINDDVGWMIEHITPQIYETTINNKPISKQVDGKWVPLDGRNPWGFVPVVYIPHVRFGNSFYGQNAFDNAKGLMLELNRRVADFGDAVSTDSHAYVGMRNVVGAPKVQKIAPNLYAVNVGSNTSITGDGKDPDIFEIKRPAASEPMGKLVDELNAEIRRHTFIPAVADGEDEGSQRSGLTLAMRMWPLTSHTNTERISWTSGLDLVNRMVLKMLLTIGEQGITIDHAVLRIKEEWAPVLPRDREMTVNEVVSRMGSKLGSPEHLLEMLGDVDDIEEEVKRIVAFAEQIAKVTAKAQPAGSGLPKKPDAAPQDKSNTASTQSTKSQSSE